MSDPQPTSLFPGEVLDAVYGYPCLYKFFPCNSQGKPLVVFVPGGFHLARIAYGGHQGSRPEDFLVYWLNEAGFNVLAISYPLETAPEIMPATCPGFRIREWGRQVAEVTKSVVEAHQLPAEVILTAWSMGGRVVVPFTKAAETLGLRVELFVALAATAGLAGVSSSSIGMTGVQCSTAGYATVPIFAKVFHAQIQAQSAQNRTSEIIPETTYLREYYGNTPISLLGYTLKHDGERFVDDAGLSINDSEVSDFARFPWIATLYPADERDTRHSLGDKATWGFIFTMKLVAMVESVKNKRGPFKDDWQRICALIATIRDKLSTQMEGNHYFFLGENGARETANTIAGHWKTYQVLRSEIEALLNSER